MGERVGINLNHLTPDDDLHECDKCGMKKASTGNGCCHDEKVVIKGAKDAISGMTCIQVNLDIVDMLVSHLDYNLNEKLGYATSEEPTFQLHGPPTYAGPPLFIRYCTFLI